MDDLQNLLQKNLEYSKEIHKKIEKIERYIYWSRVFNILKFLIIVVPLVLAIALAVPFLREALGIYKGLTDSVAAPGTPFKLPDEIIGSFIK